MKKQLLVLSPWFPYPADNGSRNRIYNIIRQLSGPFQIRLVAGVQNDSPKDIPLALSELCADVVRVPWLWHDGSRGGGVASALRALTSPVPRSILETLNPPLNAAIAAQLARPTDAVLVCELGMDAYLSPVPAALPLILDGAEITGMKQAYETANGIASRLRLGLMQAKGTRYWRRSLQRYRCVTAASRDEASALRSLFAGRAPAAAGPQILVVPNGVDISLFPPRNPAKTVVGRMIYNGSLTYGPNREAVRLFVSEMLPHIAKNVPNAHLIVTGRYDPENAAVLSGNPRVELTGYLDDLRPVLETATVCVVPLQSGGGTRLKILEAWAAGIPTVATSIGAVGLAGAVSGEHLLIADRPQEFADAVVHLLSDPEAALRIAASARQLAEDGYVWEVTTRPLVDALLAVTNQETLGTQLTPAEAQSPTPF